MGKINFIKPQIEIMTLEQNDIIVTSFNDNIGIPLPDEEWEE